MTFTLRQAALFWDHNYIPVINILQWNNPVNSTGIAMVSLAFTTDAKVIAAI